VSVTVADGVAVRVSVESVHLHVRVGVGVGGAVRVTVGVKLAVGDAVGLSGGGGVGITSAVGGTILVGTSHDANALGEQPFRTAAPAPIPATFRKSLLETIGSTLGAVA
jgi:hypothetical protein